MCVGMSVCVCVPSSQYLDDFIILYRQRAACIMKKQCVAVTGDAVNINKQVFDKDDLRRQEDLFLSVHLHVERVLTPWKIAISLYVTIT